MSEIDFSLSLYIPLVFNHISKEQIIDIFNKIHIGKVLKIDFVKRKGNCKHKMAFIYFGYWFNNAYASQLQKNIHTSKNGYKFLYNSSDYWILYKNT